MKTILLEGTELSGKTTLAKSVRQRLTNEGFSIVINSGPINKTLSLVNTPLNITKKIHSPSFREFLYTLSLITDRDPKEMYLEVDFFETLNEAKQMTQRYTHSVRWDSDKNSIRSAFRVASSHLESNYNFFTENCDDIAVDIIRSVGIELDDALRPNMSYLNFYEAGYETNSWKSLLDE